MNRVLAVARMHLTDRLMLFGFPPAILASAFVINLAIFAGEPPHSRTTGAVSSIFIVVVISAMLMTARGLSFTMSMGASRRAFALGTALVGGLLAAAFGVLLLVCNRIESATRGWGLRGHFFTFSWVDRNLAAGWLLATVLMAAMFLLGAWLSTIWLRWSQAGVVAGCVAAVVVFGGLAALVTWLGGWSSVGNWFGALSPLTAAGWAALVCLALGGASYLTLRRVAL